MWALRILNGPQAGQIYALKVGSNRIGRASTCDLQLNSPGISKEHFEIQVEAKGKVVVKDLKSSNGTFLNGTRIQASAISLGDKLSVDRILFDIVKAPANVAQVSRPRAVPSQTSAMVPYEGHALSTDAMAGGIAQMSAESMNHEPASTHHPMAHSPLDLYKQKADRYLHEVILPGLYRLVEVFPFRSVMMGFAVVFILLVTLLSLIPMNQITSESVRTESRRRALTVARALANSNEKAIRSGDITSYSADLVLRDEGISNVFILGKDGSVMAPPEYVGMQPKELAGFTPQIKGQTREISADIGSGKIAASCPILVFDPEVQQNVARAHAVVVYDTNSLHFDDGRALGLFIQMLAIALIIGVGLFFLMYKLIEYPFRRLNQELDGALREGRDHAHVEMNFPLLQQLLVSVNSLLTRSHHGGAGGSTAASANTRDEEWSNMIQLFGYPALLLNKEMQIVTVNSAFESLTGAQRHLIQGQALAYLPDQALQKNIEELVKAAHNNTHVLHQDRLDISGHVFDLQCQAMTVAGEARYFLVSISPSEQAEGGAA